MKGKCSKYDPIAAMTKDFAPPFSYWEQELQDSPKPPGQRYSGTTCLADNSSVVNTMQAIQEELMRPSGGIARYRHEVAVILKLMLSATLRLNACHWGGGK
jgi:hypothetical protein